MTKSLKNTECTVIAGPCSIDEKNIKEVFRISEMEVKNRRGKYQRAVAGTRVVGLKSRTELTDTGIGMGMDYHAVQKNIDVMIKGGGVADFEIPPSAHMAKRVNDKTGMLIATEVMMPAVQLPAFEQMLPKGALMPWNPSVNQLGWQVHEMARFARRNNWHLGIKNGKWVGEALHVANSPHFTGKTTMEKTWAGLASYAGKLSGNTILIHRGVDVPDKGNYRSFPVHRIAERTKRDTKLKLYFDPSHALGPKMRDEIVAATIEAMKMQTSWDGYLYDGILIEVGTSVTDTHQHITLKELEYLLKELAKFRNLEAPNTH